MMSVKNESQVKKRYSAPVIQIFGSIRAMTQAIGTKNTTSDGAPGGTGTNTKSR